MTEEEVEFIEYDKPVESDGPLGRNLLDVLESSVDGEVHGEFDPGAEHGFDPVSVSIRHSIWHTPAYFGRLRQGGVVVDARPLRKGRGWQAQAWTFVLSMPMLDLRLKPAEASPCGPVPEYMLGPGGLEGEFRTLARLQQTGRFRGLDKIALPEWLDLWRSRGARVGVRDGDTIRWESGHVDVVVPEAERWAYCWEEPDPKEDEDSPEYARVLDLPAFIARTCRNCGWLLPHTYGDWLQCPYVRDRDVRALRWLGIEGREIPEFPLYSGWEKRQAFRDSVAVPSGRDPCPCWKAR